MLNKQTQCFVECIDSNLLIACGAIFKKYDKGTYIFRESQEPHFYHQLVEGSIKMINVNEVGKEFIQGFISVGDSFGDSSIFDNTPYACDAFVEKPSIVLRLHLSTFIQLLKDNFDVHLHFTKILATKLANKTNALKEMVCNNPEERILSILKKNKKNSFGQTQTNCNRARVDFTRKDIAEMSGLRVETVIRIMRHMQDQKLLTIERGKVYY